MPDSVHDAATQPKKSRHRFCVSDAAPKTSPVPGSAPNAEKNINVVIDHQCPQCGAPVQLGETDRLIRCEYCRTSVYLVANRFFRYLIPDNAPADKDLIYFPYWRFKGMLFSCLVSGIQDRFLDVSQQAVKSPLLPASVGLRSQAMKLRFVSPDTTGWFIRPTLQLEQVMEAFLAHFNLSLPGPVLCQAHVGESLSMIYAPFYLSRQIMDAVLNHPVSSPLEPDFDFSHFKGGPAACRMRFIPTLCPNCGWDLQGHRDALVLHCANCATLWKASEKGMRRIAVAHLPARTNGEIIYLPFWRIRAEVLGMDLDTYADLIPLANLPKVVRPDWHRRPFHFWGPAFKLRPQSFLRLTHQITVSQPHGDWVDTVPAGVMHPVNLPVSESAETLRINLAGILRPWKRVETQINSISTHPRRYLLVYLPFEKRHHDLVQPTLNIAVNRNQLALSANL